MDLAGARLAEHRDQCALGVPADDGIVDHDDPAAGDGVPERAGSLDARLPDGLAGLDEGPAGEFLTSPWPKGMPLASAKPIAAGVPDSGAG